MNHLNAITPACNAVVLASAGTGKTWLLVARLIRLLLEGTPPAGILAITFTRKAALEMQERLSQRLLELACLEQAELDAALAVLGLTADAIQRQRVRDAYETLLKSEHSPRITTFHAFCQELLRRFPLEADVPPGFDLIENAGVLSQAALEALLSEATKLPDSPLAHALECLMRHTRGADAVRMLLLRFLEHRSDWWACTEGSPDPAAHATRMLAQQLQVDSPGTPARDFFVAETLAQLDEFATLLLQHPNASNTRDAELIHALLSGNNAVADFDAVCRVFLTADGAPRARKLTRTLSDKLGSAGAERLLALHGQLSDLALQALELEARRLTLALSSAWFSAGARLLQHYQRIKAEQRLLDFSDLEWKASQLLQHSDNAQWVQYKLDQRIDHLLVDEFQDTNPTQWRLLLPLLEELAAGQSGRARSVFLVGDLKQSIYGFRRANPELFTTAALWLEKNLNAPSYPLDVSWRFAPVLCDFFNQVFEQRLPAFHPHSTHRTTLWGQIELLPLIRPEAAEQQRPVTHRLRNPLQQPRPAASEQQHLLEGRQIAQRICDLVETRTPVQDGAHTRVINYNDILILVRNRTHVSAYESALRAAGIPFIGATRGTLLDTLEVQDMIALLDVLITPYDNLALAQVMRSPLFACSDDDLIQLATDTSTPYWIDRLATLASSLAPGAPLARAQRWLSRWCKRAGQVPMHDLLDSIYAEGNVLARYEAAFPPGLKTRVCANLIRFLELALEVDSGRYPSPGMFRARLDTLRDSAQEAPDEAPAPAHEARVRILTVHAAKGLEAAVVFVADATATASARGSQPLIYWPAEADRPSHFFLPAKSGIETQLGGKIQRLLDAAAQREEMNLLYVALTRARQYLFISGCAPRKGSALGWYEMIAQRLQPDGDPLLAGWLQRSAIPPAPLPASSLPTEVVIPPDIDSRLSQPVPAIRPSRLSPSHTGDAATLQQVRDADAVLRGTAIHRLLDRLSLGAAVSRGHVLRQLATDLLLHDSDARLPIWWDEVQRVLQAPTLQFLFADNTIEVAYNETPLYYEADGQHISGVVDRLVVTPDTVWIVDYKTRATVQPDHLAQAAAPYQAQMRLYAHGAMRLWPQRQVRPVLLFTACAGLVEVAP
ncbi:MAG: UvrD-helicase domain-containing protein [Gammaproteobacteria bacterium]|nr:UvrD-helicase domain-containing protein [Gammaproteobacteria bacterium]